MFVWILLVIGLYLLRLRCRRGQPGLEALRGWDYAHRGLHGEGVPENSMAAFREALEQGYGIELDVHLLKDGNLAVIHDSQLARTTGRPGRVEDLTTRDLAQCRLQGSGQTIPELADVLELFQGKAPIILELKSDGKNYAELTEAACKMLDTYSGVFCMESFDPRCLIWLRRNRPDILRGQLAENGTSGALPGVLNFLLKHCLGNFLTVPDFIAYKFSDRRSTASTFLCQRLWGAQMVAWTIRTPEDLRTARQEGWLPIFEGFAPPRELDGKDF